MTVDRPVTLALDLDPDVLTALVQDLARREWTVAAAESLTAGLLTTVLTEVPGSSAVVRGGLVVYATDLKQSLADVPAELLARVGPVDPDVARALAHGARRRCRTTFGIGLTGVAGPSRQEGHPIGTVHVAVADERSARVVTLSPTGEPASRATVRAAAVRAAVDLLRSAVGGA